MLQNKKKTLIKEKIYSLTYTKKTFFNLKEAAEIMEYTKPKMRAIALKFDLGRKIEGKFLIDPFRLKKYIQYGTNSIPYKKVRKGPYHSDCPIGYKFGKDHDDHPKCKDCDNYTWVRCGERYDQLIRLKNVVQNKSRIYSEKELQEKILEMENRL